MEQKIKKKNHPSFSNDKWECYLGELTEGKTINQVSEYNYKHLKVNTQFYNFIWVIFIGLTFSGT